MLDTVDIKDEMEYIIIESDNCCKQYKSAEHFYDLLCISNNTNKPIIRVFGIAGHGKGEVDHVGGIAKIAIRREIANDADLKDAEDMVTFLLKKFESNNHHLML
jgi:hypothetical protein